MLLLLLLLASPTDSHLETRAAEKPLPSLSADEAARQTVLGKCRAAAEANGAADAFDAVVEALRAADGNAFSFSACL